MTEAMRRITRSHRDRVFGGVCGGIARYVGWDPVLVRILYVALTLLSNGAGILVYLIAWIIILLDETGLNNLGEQARSPGSSARSTLGIVLLVVGALALAGSFVPLFWSVPLWRLVGPLFLLGLGVALIINRKDRGQREDETGESKSGDHTMPEQPLLNRHETRRRLVRIERGRKIAGICTGLGEYFDVDPTLIRLVWVALVLMAGTGIVLYLIMWLVMPLERELQP